MYSQCNLIHDLPELETLLKFTAVGEVTRLIQLKYKFPNNET